MPAGTATSSTATSSKEKAASDSGDAQSGDAAVSGPTGRAELGRDRYQRGGSNERATSIT